MYAFISDAAVYSSKEMMLIDLTLTVYTKGITTIISASVSLSMK
jgi:hypothetical protein